MPSRSKKPQPIAAAPARVNSAAALRKLHRTMLTAIREPLTPSWDMRKKNRAGQSMNKLAATFMKPNDRLSAGERLEIYNKQYWFRLTDCLIDDFPSVRALIGHNAFNALSQAYIEQCPSRRFTLRDLGKRLPAFLKSNPQLAGKHPALACDIARYEWAMIVAFDEAEFPPFKIDDLLGQNPATFTLKLQPHVQLLALAYPIDDMLLAVKKERSAAAVEAGTRQTQPRPKPITRHIPKPHPTFLAVHRHALDIYHKRLDPAAFAIISALAQGTALEKACAKGAAAFPGNPAAFPATLQSWFRDWAHLGWFHRHA